MECGACWMPRSSRIETLTAVPMRRAASPDQAGVHVGPAAVVVDVDVRDRGDHLLVVLGVRVQEVMVQQVLLDQHREHRRQQGGVLAGAHLQVDVGLLGRLAAAWVDHDQGALGVRRDGLEGRGVRAGTRGPSTGSCRRTPPPPRSRSPGPCASRGRTDARRSRSRRSSPGPARWRRSASPVPRAWPPSARRRGGCPGRRRRSRRSTRRRGGRAPRPGRPPPRRSPCPSRPPHSFRPRACAAGA